VKKKKNSKETSHSRSRRQFLRTLTLAAGGFGAWKSERVLAKGVGDMPLTGFESALSYPLIPSILGRRSRRIAKGHRHVAAGSASHTSNEKRQPLEPLEEALLISVIGMTGYTMPDRPFQDEKGNFILGTPNIKMPGRAAGSADNAQHTHFFMINDTGTYYLRPWTAPEPGFKLTPENLIQRAEGCKVKVLDHRLDFPREFPYYFDSNRFLSNLEGSTLFVPVVDFTSQYINGLMYLLTQPDGNRPVFIDDRNGFAVAGLEKWVKDGYLNPEISLPLGLLSNFRSHIEADLLLQNLMLTLQPMGLGGWIHACFEGPFLLGHPRFQLKGNKGNFGLGFRYEVPDIDPDILKKKGIPHPSLLANPVGKDGLIEGLCPPYRKDMSEAVDALLKIKYGENGAYTDEKVLNKIFKNDLGSKYAKEVPHYAPETVQCVKDVCNYIYKTHGRFPAHVDAMHVPGVWLQAHHLDLGYYDHLFQNGYLDTHRDHQKLWH
jgi:hypothetical protein